MPARTKKQPVEEVEEPVVETKPKRAPRKQAKQTEEVEEPAETPKKAPRKQAKQTEEVEEPAETPKKAPRKQVEEVEETAETSKKAPRKQARKEEPVEEPAKPKRSTKKSKAESEAEEDVPKKKNLRCFRAVDPETGRLYGRYTGKDQFGAANKTFSQEKKRINKENKGKKAQDRKPVPTEKDVYLRETTQGSDKQFYGVHVWAHKLDTPHERALIDPVTKQPVLDDKGKPEVIQYHYRNKNEEIPVPDDLEGKYKAWNERERAAKAALKAKAVEEEEEPKQKKAPRKANAAK